MILYVRPDSQTAGSCGTLMSCFMRLARTPVLYPLGEFCQPAQLLSGSHRSWSRTGEAGSKTIPLGELGVW